MKLKLEAAINASYVVIGRDLDNIKSYHVTQKNLNLKY